MAVRDILNYLGQVVGELELPDGTSEEVWTARLAPYAAPPPSQQDQILAQLKRSVVDGKKASDEVMQAFKEANLADFIDLGLSNEAALSKSMWVHHRLRAVDINVGGLAMTIDLMNLCISGDLETAYVILTYMSPDDMSQPYHFLSQTKINALQALIASKIGL
jgi:hypothetical protein